MSTLWEKSYLVSGGFAATANLELYQRESHCVGVVHHMCQLEYDDVIGAIAANLLMSKRCYQYNIVLINRGKTNTTALEDPKNSVRDSMVEIVKNGDI